MAELKVIDDIVNEICKIRGVDMPPVCVKAIFLAYLMYCCNTYNVKYKNEDGYTVGMNGGCLIFCQKGTGKSRTLKVLKKIFNNVEVERQRRYHSYKDTKIGALLRSMIPLNADQKKEIEDFYKESGKFPVEIFEDPSTSKVLCETYAQSKTYKVNNILFSIDEVGDRLFRDAFGRSPSISSKEFLSSVNQLFDGRCSMGNSKTSKDEGIQSQDGVGANFIFVSTAEFLKDGGVADRFKTWLAGGVERRLIYINCPPIDKLKTSRKRYFPNFNQFLPIAKEIFTGDIFGKEIKASETLWTEVLEKEGAGCGIPIEIEFLLLLFCTTLVIWTGETEIEKHHWDYMFNVYREIQNISMTVIQKDSTSYEKICVFMEQYFNKNSGKKKMPIALIKDYCVRNRMCFESHFKKYFDNLCKDFSETNTSKYLIEKNQIYAWLEENFAYGG